MSKKKILQVLCRTVFMERSRILSFPVSSFQFPVSSNSSFRELKLAALEKKLAGRIPLAWLRYLLLGAFPLPWLPTSCVAALPLAWRADTFECAVRAASFDGQTSCTNTRLYHRVDVVRIYCHRDGPKALYKQKGSVTDISVHRNVRGPALQSYCRTLNPRRPEPGGAGLHQAGHVRLSSLLPG